MMENICKTAAIIFVKDEVEDIAWWIAWHRSIGFSTIIVYDDYSSDGTWEIVEHAARVIDVRPRRAVQSLRFNHRQALTYSAAIDEFREEFDWLIFLDADEYVDIHSGETVTSFLARYPDDVDQISLNWKCFGSNRNVEKPPSPNVFENYTTHSGREFDLNNCVKSFFRPKRTESRYINPHRFAVSGRTITPDGAEVTWQEEHPERTNAAPDWSIALVRHYIIRSVEHYVEKSKRRSDIRGARIGIGLFNAYDRNEHYDEMPASRVAALTPWLYLIQNEVARVLYQEIAAHPPTNAMPHMEIGKMPVETISPVTYFQTFIYAERVSGRLCHTAQPSEFLVPITFFCIPHLFPNTVFLTAEEEFLPLNLIGESRVSTVLSYEIIKIQEHSYALRSPLTRKVISFLEPSMDTGIGYTECNRDWTSDWETLVNTSSQTTEDPIINALARAIPFFSAPDDFALDLDQPRRIDAMVAGLAASTEPLEYGPVLRQILRTPWMKKDSRLSL